MQSDPKGVPMSASPTTEREAPMTERKGGTMSTPAITVPGPHALAGREEVVDRYEGVKQYSLLKILAVWAAAALPMAALAWLVAPALEDSFGGEENVPLVKALLICLTAGLIWQFVLVVVLVRREQGTLALAGRPRRALAPCAQQPEDRPSRRPAVADPDSADLAVRARRDDSGGRHAVKSRPRGRSSPRTAGKPSSAAPGAGSPLSSSFRSSTPCSARNCSSVGCSCRG